MSVVIQLTRGYTTVIDDADEELVQLIPWRAQGRAPNIYAAVNLGGRTNPRLVCLHRELLHAPPGLEVDHVNGDKLDNRRANLRLATHRQNSCNQKVNSKNTSGATGVSRAHDGKWRAYIKVHQKQIWLGAFDRFEDAVAARVEAERIHFGEFRRQA